MSKQVFVLLDFPKPNHEYGKFLSHDPKEAACQAFAKISDYYDISNKETEKKYLLFALKNKNNNKIHEYIGAKIELFKPMKINNKLVKYRNLVLPKPKFVNFNILK